MPNTLDLSRRFTRLRAPLFAACLVALVGCDDPAETFSAESPATPEALAEQPLVEEIVTGDDAPVSEEPAGVEAVALDAEAAVSFAGGIPFGTFHQPNSLFGSIYNGALRNIWPAYVVSNLAAIKSRGGKVVLSFAGSERNFKDADGHFSLSKWKTQVARYRNVNFSSYINDGTVIGHYLVDEPNDPANWSGRPIPPSVVEDMAAYSKQLWPNMPTIVRAAPDYMDNWSGSYRYLDAAWAQYVARKGDVDNFINSNIAAAKRKGLALVVGLNVIKGGTTGGRMSASQIRSWGAALLASSYPCAFLSWQYDSYLSNSSVRDAMDYLRNRSEARSTKSCRGA